MDNLRIAFAVGSAVFSLVALVPYVIDIIRGTTRPERASWLIWSTLGLIALASQYASGARWSLLFTVAQTFGVLVVLGLSFKKGTGGYSKLDITCLMGALIGLVIWGFTRQPLTALAFVIGIDLLGVIPTVVKAYHDPDSETKLTWLLDSFAGLLALLSVSSLVAGVVIYPLYIMVANFAVYVAIVASPVKRLESASLPLKED